MAHPTDPDSVFAMLCYKNGGVARQVRPESATWGQGKGGDGIKAGSRRDRDRDGIATSPGRDRDRIRLEPSPPLAS